MIELQTSVKQDDTTRTRTPKPGYLNFSILSYVILCVLDVNNISCLQLWEGTDKAF
jgi:hypothetical protein